MSRNGSGIYNLPNSSWYPAVNGITATANDWNSLATDIQSALTQSVSSDGQTPMTGNLPMGNNRVTGMVNGIAPTDAATLGQIYSASGQAGSPSFRNRLINGNFSINQIPVSGSVTLVAGAYGHDGWKAGAAGCTYTFATVGGVTTLTITAGTIVQVIEASNVEGGIYCMSWVGTSTGKIGAGSFAASGVNSASQAVGVSFNVEFSTGTLSKVQLEPGTTPTAFERKRPGDELFACQRYFEKGIFQIGGAYPTGGVGAVTVGTICFKADKYAAPSMSQLPASSSTNVSTNGFNLPSPDACGVSVTQGPAVGNYFLYLAWSASARL